MTNTVHKNRFLQALHKGPVVFDGAMGTLLYERGLLYTASFEQACLTNPALVRQIHLDYVRAGAQAIETNTFGANRYRQAPHGLEDQVVAMNKAAVAIAREVAREQAFVLGAVGPTGLMLKTMNAEEQNAVQEAFLEQCKSLVEAGADALVLQTFRQPEEMRLAMLAAKEACADTVPIVASVSFDTFGSMADGTEPERMAELLAEWGADALGVNCATGPAGVFEMVVRMKGPKLPLVAEPNAGFPRRVDGRLAYMATPEYFLVYARRLFKAGIHGVGGCCGTTAEHVKKIGAAARMMGAAVEPGGGMREEEEQAQSQLANHAPRSLHELGALGAKLSTKFVVSVEVNPPSGLCIERAMEGARLLQAGGVDVINVADGARASARMSNLALCLRIQEKLNLPTLLHVTTRDRNMLGLLAHLLGAHELGVRNLVVITGDPPKMGEFPDATAVYDLDSVGLLRLIAGLNRGLDPGGKPMDAPTHFLCATGVEPAAQDYRRELTRLRAKHEAGAHFVMTQPVYDPAVLDRFLEDVRPLNMPVLVGLLPLASYRNAEFLHNEVPGMKVPEGIRERMRKAGGGESGRAEGIAIAREMLQAVKNRVQGAYIMPPFGRYDLALEVLEGIL